MKRKTTGDFAELEVDYKKRKEEKGEMNLQKIAPKWSQILSPEELVEKIRRDEEYRRKAEFRGRLDIFICGDYINNYLEYIINGGNHQVGIDKELLDARLCDYYNDAPSKTLKDFLEEKGWKIRN